VHFPPGIEGGPGDPGPVVGVAVWGRGKVGAELTGLSLLVVSLAGVKLATAI
jgi:hypothetical protein